MISCVVSAYNEALTISKVIETLLEVKSIDEIIVVDDGSTDNTKAKLETFGNKIIVCSHETNLGKGTAVVTGVLASSGDTIMMCDADLTNLAVDHIDNLIKTFINGSYGLVLAARENNVGIGYIAGKLTGERIFKKKVIMPYLQLIKDSDMGVELIINFAHREKSVKTIISKNIGHLQKQHKLNIFGLIIEFSQEMFQLFKTYLYLHFYLPKTS